MYIARCPPVGCGVRLAAVTRRGGLPVGESWIRLTVAWPKRVVTKWTSPPE